MSTSNPMPKEVYSAMLQYYPEDGHEYDLHHALVDFGDVMGMPLDERKKIHDPRNLWWVNHAAHASHANIASKQVYYWVLCKRFGKAEVDAFILSFNWKSTPPVTIAWLEGSS